MSMPDRVQSVDRAFGLLEHMADAGGPVGLSELATISGLPLPTIHRLIRSLVNQGYVRQERSRRYALGPGLIRLGESANRMLGSWAVPYLSELVDEIGETSNMATLEGDTVVYVAQVPSLHSMRMFTEVGRRVMPHCTGVGKALLSMLPDAEVRALIARTGMPPRTERTITDPEVLVAEVARSRQRGYAVDDQEQEAGVRCVAVPVSDAPVRAAISVSGPSSRVSSQRVASIAPVLQRVASRLVTDLRGDGS
jgi:IclR family transcriptional regulator, acetate operon repressor